MQIAKWGNSLAVRLPVSVVEALGLKEGDELNIRGFDAEKADLEFVKKPDPKRLISEVRKKYAGALPADFKFDREEANERVPHERD